MRGGVEQLSTDYQMCNREQIPESNAPVSYTHLRAHETRHDFVFRLLLEKKDGLLSRMPSSA